MMDIKITPTPLSGTVNAIPSKSQAHRLLICAALSDSETNILCSQSNEDIDATVNCLNALGAQITRTSDGFQVCPIITVPKTANLPCGESGSTLRFILPIAGALGVTATFELKGRLPQRPLSPLWEEMERMGCFLSRPTEDTILCSGKLRSGLYQIAGNVSSQFISGLLFALSIIHNSTLKISGRLESAPYVNMTKLALLKFGITVQGQEVNGHFHSPGNVDVEGDWSNGAFFLTAKALGQNIQVINLNTDSPQGDREIARLLPLLKTHQTISAKDIPDLVPILSVAAAANQGAVFTDIDRLRLKESDRVKTVIAMLANMGIHAEDTGDSLIVSAGLFQGGTVDAANDHRIAMAAAIAACIAADPVTIIGAQCVKKSYPHFWEDYKELGGHYEQYIR